MPALISEVWNGALAWSFRVEKTVVLMRVTDEKVKSVGEKRLFSFSGMIEGVFLY